MRMVVCFLLIVVLRTNSLSLPWNSLLSFPRLQVRIMLSRFNDTSAPSALRADAVCILSRLCSNHKDNQAGFRRDGGIVSLVSFTVGTISS